VAINAALPLKADRSANRLRLWLLGRLRRPLVNVTTKFLAKSNNLRLLSPFNCFQFGRCLPFWIWSEINSYLSEALKIQFYTHIRDLLYLFIAADIGYTSQKRNPK